MGIQSLLPFLEKSTRNCHVSEFRGLTVAIDSYCWLHKGARSCALQLAKGQRTTQYVHYCMKYIKMLLSYNIKPILVFDGRHLPAKMKTEEKRRESKKIAHKQGVEMLRLGKSDEAYKFFCQAIDVTPEMALDLIKECRAAGIDCIVAPYESDAQLAFLNTKGIADCIISEDSDLILFGCSRVLYKMDLNGCGQLVESDKIPIAMKLKPEQFSFDKFRYMCILSGCDYVDSLPGIGLKKALKFISMTAETDPEIFLDRVPRYLNLRHLTITSDYKQQFLSANATFLHQIVFDPLNRKLVNLNPIVTTKLEYCNCLGEMFDDDTALQLSLGNLDPLTMKTIDRWEPHPDELSEFSIWARTFKHRPVKTVPSLNSGTLTPRPQTKVIVTVNEIEESKRQQDKQFNRELDFYKNLQDEDDLDISNKKEESEGTESDDSKMSPVLGSYSKNPFTKRKISRFSITEQIDSTVVVKSRFFATESSVTSCLNKENDNDDGFVELTPSSCDDLSISNTLTSSTLITTSTNEVPVPREEKVISLLSVENTLSQSQQPAAKKRKVLTKKAVSGKQTTIKDMFKRMNTT